MFVCICRAVTESRIRAAINAGASTVDEVEAVCGAGGDCGSCRGEISEMIADAQGSPCAGCPNARRDSQTHRAA